MAVAAVATATAALGATLAWAGETITTSAASDTFTQSSFTIDQGEIARLNNTSIGSTDHNVVSSGKGPDGYKLFRSPDIRTGQSAAVNGTQYLTQGSYHFTCTIHIGMEADLAVSGSGTPVPRPDIELEVVSRKLDKVVGSRKLKVEVTAVTDSDNVDLVAKKGAKQLGSKPGIDLSAGATKIVRLRVTGSGRNAIKDLGQAKVKVTGSMPFGAPNSAKRTLR